MARLTDDNVRLAREIIGRYPRPRSATIPLLHLAQQQDGYVTNDAMAHIGELVGATSAEVYGTASFYEMFKFEPVGKYGSTTRFRRTARWPAFVRAFRPTAVSALFRPRRSPSLRHGWMERPHCDHHLPPHTGLLRR